MDNCRLTIGMEATDRYQQAKNDLIKIFLIVSNIAVYPFKSAPYTLWRMIFLVVVFSNSVLRSSMLRTCLKDGSFLLIAETASLTAEITSASVLPLN